MKRPKQYLRHALFALMCGAVLTACGGGGGGGGGSSPPPSGAEIQGQVTDPRTDQANGVADASVVLVAGGDVEALDSIQPMEDAANAVLAGSNTAGFSTTTDGNGNYTISGVPDGAYYLVVMPASNDTEHLPAAKRKALTITDGQLAADQDGNIEVSQVQSSSANYVGASTCLTCHPSKQKAKKTLHFMGFRKVGMQAETVPNGLQDLNSTVPYNLQGNADAGLSDWFTDPPTDIILSNDSSEHALLGKDDGGTYFQVGSDAAAAATHPKFRVKFTYGGETGLWKMRYITIVGDSDGLPAGLWGVNNKGTIGGASGNGFGYFEMAPMQFQEKFEGSVDPATGIGTPGPNGVAGPFVKYHDDRWDFAGTGTVAGQFTADPKAKSWDTNCASCHGGDDIIVNADGDHEVKFPLDPNGYTIDDGTLNKYDINVGCEKCHGPGSEHVQVGGRGRFIVMPNDLTPGRATQICGTCHIRGENHTDLGGEVPLLANGAGEFKIFRPGHSPATYFGTADGNGILPFGNESDSLVNGYLEPINYETNKNSWQDKIYQQNNPFVTPTAAGDRTQVTGSFNHSKGHHQQFMDVTRSTMYKNDKQMTICFDCHDAHGSEQDHQLVYNADNNAACLTCHNDSLRPPAADETAPDESQEGKHPANFQFITQEQADDLAATGTVADSIATEVMRHVGTWTGNNLMGTLDYDPDGSAGSDAPGSGRCTLCHMPKTSKSASFAHAIESKSGKQYLEADIHSHTFDVTATEAVNAMEGDKGASGTTPAGMTNACGVCHGAFDILN